MQSARQQDDLILEFRFDPRAIEDATDMGDLRRVDAPLLAFSYFLMPVRLKVGDVELLEPVGDYVYIPREKRSRFIRLYDNDGQLLPLTVDDRTLLASSPEPLPSPWTPLALLSVAMFGRAAVNEALAAGAATYDHADGGESLTFTVVGDRAQIESGVNGRVAETAAVSLREAFGHFAERVRSVLGQECPELKEHPYWGPWFHDACDPWFEGTAPHPWPR